MKMNQKPHNIYLFNYFKAYVCVKTKSKMAAYFKMAGFIQKLKYDVVSKVSNING